MQQIGSFLNFLVIQNFTGFVTLLTGSVAWLVYTSQKRDKKINAARIILSEIRTAEEAIDEIKSDLESVKKDFPSVLPINSWEKYAYLFVSDFDQDQISEVNNFYNNCSVIQDAIKRDDSYFWLAADSTSQAALSKQIELIYESMKDPKKEDYSIDIEKLVKLSTSVLDSFTRNPYVYIPQRTLVIIKSRLVKINKITTSTTGVKLKRLAQISNKSSGFFTSFGI